MNEATSGHLELHIASARPGALAEASRQLQDYLGQRGVGERARYTADLAVEELGTNILSYAFPAGVTAAFTLRASVKPNKVELVFEDNGSAFDPTAASTPKSPGSLPEATIGGLGIHMVRQASDRMTYTRHGTCNRLEVQIPRNS